MLARLLRLGLIVVFLYTAAMLVASCQKENGDFEWLPLYGDGLHDSTPVVAEVGDVKITVRDMELRMDELPNRLKAKYAGPAGQRLLLADMVDQVLLVQAAVSKELFNDQDVARSLISLRRETLQDAMRNYGLLRGKEPSEEDLREFYRSNKDQYRRLGLVRARHVECLTEADADKAFARLQLGGMKNSFPYVAGEMSVNKETSVNQGETGWYNRGGFLPQVTNGKLFTEVTFDLELGLHPPVKVKDRWHVVEILSRDHERAMSFSEARDLVMADALPGFQQEIIKDFLTQARAEQGVVFSGEFGPGQGLTPEEIINRAVAVNDPQKKIELLDMVIDDFPESEYADDALLMAAMTMLENWQDRRMGSRYLRLLVEGYPDSPLYEDAKYLRDNLNNPEVLDPTMFGTSDD